MSRIGKQPVDIPAGIEIKIENGKITAKKGNITETVDTKNYVDIKMENNKIFFIPKGEDRVSKAFWGTYRALTNNMIMGLVKGFEKKLEINGVGYRAQISGKNLEMQLGFSHPVIFPIPDGIEIKVEKNIIVIKGHDKQKVGETAAKIRRFRPPEPYKGKGIKYADEVIIRKAGKTAKK
jgi:large subunit ribosomal protein L6